MSGHHHAQAFLAQDISLFFALIPFVLLTAVMVCGGLARRVRFRKPTLPSSLLLPQE